MAQPWEADAVISDVPAATAKPWEADAVVDNPSAPAKPKNEPFNYTFLPIHVDEQGGISPGVPGFLSGLADSAVAAYSAPYRAYTGDLPMTNTDGSTSDQAIEEAANMASWLNLTNSGFRVKTTPSDRAAANLAAAEKAASREGNQINMAAKRIGVELPRSTTSDSKFVQGAGKWFDEQPIVGAPMRRATEKSVEQLDDAVKGVKDTLGSGSTYNAGSEVKTAATKYAKEKEGFLTKQEDKRYRPAEALITPNVITPLTKTGETMLEIMARRDNATLPDGPAVRMVKKAVFKQHGEKITDLSVPVKPGETVESVFNLSTGLNYQGIKDLRSYVRETLDDPFKLSRSGMSQKDLDKIYAALSTDLRSAVVRGGGPKALAEWEKANLFAARANREREALQKIIGSKEPEAIVDSISAMAGTNSRASLNKLFQARKSVDQETWDELSSAVIERMGRDADGNFSPERWLTARGKLSDLGKAALFNTTGKKDLMKTLDDIDKVSRRIVEVNKDFGNPSGTGRSNAFIAAGTAAVKAPLKLATGVLGGRLMATYLSQPAEAKAVADYLKAMELAQRMPSLATNEAFKTKASYLARLAANEMGNPALSEGIAAKLMLGEKAAADEDQDEQAGMREGENEPAQADQEFSDAYLRGQAL